MASLALSQRFPRSNSLRPLQCIATVPFFGSKPRARLFSATSRRKFIDIPDLCLHGANYALSGLHSLGLPWYLVIPTSAALVRGVLVYHLATKPRRKAAQIRSQLVPLAAAQARHRTMASQKMEVKSARKGEDMNLRSPAIWRVISSANYMKSLWILSAAHKASILNWQSFANFGILILFTEAVRLKCNAHTGLWSLITAPFTWYSPQTPTAPTKSMEEQLVERLEQMRATKQLDDASGGLQTIAADQQAVEHVLQDVPSTIDGGEPTSFYDPTMASEGLTWCIDLTVPDPYFILPGVLGAALFANVLLRRIRLGRQSALTSESSLRNVALLDRPLNLGERISLSVGLLLTLASTQWPAAVVLYFAANVTVGWAQQRWLDRTIPILPPIAPSKRPAEHTRPAQWQQEQKILQ